MGCGGAGGAGGGGGNTRRGGAWIATVALRGGGVPSPICPGGGKGSRLAKEGAKEGGGGTGGKTSEKGRGFSPLSEMASNGLSPVVSCLNHLIPTVGIKMAKRATLPAATHTPTLLRRGVVFGVVRVIMV